MGEGLLFTHQQANEMWSRIDGKQRVDKPRLKGKPKKPAIHFVNHVTRYRRLHRQALRAA